MDGAYEWDKFDIPVRGCHERRTSNQVCAMGKYAMWPPQVGYNYYANFFLNVRQP